MGSQAKGCAIQKKYGASSLIRPSDSGHSYPGMCKPVLETSDYNLWIHAIEVCRGSEIEASLSRGQVSRDALLLGNVASHAELILKTY